jgi:hypothetical protein
MQGLDVRLYPAEEIETLVEKRVREELAERARRAGRSRTASMTPEARRSLARCGRKGALGEETGDGGKRACGRLTASNAFDTRASNGNDKPRDDPQPDVRRI